MDSNGNEVYMRLPEACQREAVDGITYDFLYGVRIRFPEDGGPWHLVVADSDTGTVHYDAAIQDGQCFISRKKYYVRWYIRIERAGALIWEYTLDLKDEKVVIAMPVSTLGDTVAWFPYIDEFRKAHGCNTVAVVGDKFRDLFIHQYPDLSFRDKQHAMDDSPLAAFFLGLWWNDETDHQPVDHRLVGLHKTAAHILGLDTQQEYRPRFDLSAPRRIAEPYVCIAAQSTTMSKNWTPDGWIKVVEFLKDSGYRVLCMDKDRVNGRGIIHNVIPWGSEDFTGDISLQERINIIKDADFFIGLASGLSWFAWACGVPVVLISGFSLPHTEFYTPYRVINYSVCNGCWNDVRHNFDHTDFLWCPRHQGDEQRQHECMRKISAHQVIETIKKIPAFQRRTHNGI